jgi:hypothetical protein
MNKREYSDDEAREILKRAVAYQERDDFKFSEQQLLDLGREMGLSQDAIVKASQDFQRGAETPVVGATPKGRKSAIGNQDISAEEAAFQREHMMIFYMHFAIYLSVVALVFTINALTNGLSFPWFLFVVFGWGIGVVAHFMAARFLRGDEYEDAFEEWLDKQETRQRKRQRRLGQIETKE